MAAKTDQAILQFSAVAYAVLPVLQTPTSENHSLILSPTLRFQRITARF